MATSDTDHQQQELFVLVAARLAARRNSPACQFEEVVTAPDDASARAEILLLSSSILVPCLRHEGATVWDTLAIAEYLNEVRPDAGLLPADRVQRAHCRSICGEIHSGFTTLRASLPVNLKGHFPGFKIWSRAQADIDRVCTIWRDCLAQSGGPFLFGERTMADAMYAPVVTRFMTYDVKLEPRLVTYANMIMAMPEMRGVDRGRQGRARRHRGTRGRILGSVAPCPFEGLKARAGFAVKPVPPRM